MMSFELAPEGRLKGPAGQRQILVADDDPRTQRLLIALLDFVGLTAVIARDGSEALEESFYKLEKVYFFWVNKL